MHEPALRRLIAVRPLRMHALAVALLLAACPGQGDGKAPPPGGKQPARQFDNEVDDKAGSDDKAANPTDAAKAPDKAVGDKPVGAKPNAGLGKVLGGPLPIEGLLGKAPADVEAQLSEPLGKGMMRKSCVRFLPERTWFSCSFATQRYGDKSGAYTAIGVEFQDGIATAISFEGPKNATGEFSPKAALAYVGLELPGEPKLEPQDGGVMVHSWFNASSRLLIGGKQYRVVVSNIENDWARTKVEVILNHPLTDEERQRVMPAGGDAPPPG